MGLILLGVGAPMFLGFVLIALDTRLDLSDGRPRSAQSSDAAVPVGWPSLRQDDVISGRDGINALPKNGSPVKMLGYMMEGYQFAPSGSRVSMFILMPEAGHFLHPAHRNPDEMVEVWPEAGSIIFKNRDLVWASGRFERLAGAKEGHALYAMRRAIVASARQQDVARWFIH